MLDEDVKRRYTQTASSSHTRNHICFSFIFYIHQTKDSICNRNEKNYIGKSLIFLSDFLQLIPKNQTTFHFFKLFYCSYEYNKYSLGSCTVLSCATLPVPVTDTGWKEKKHMKLVTLSFFPVKWTVWVKWWYKDFYWCSKIWDQFKSKKQRFMRGCISDYWCEDW